MGNLLQILEETLQESVEERSYDDIKSPEIQKIIKKMKIKEITKVSTRRSTKYGESQIMVHVTTNIVVDSKHKDPRANYEDRLPTAIDKGGEKLAKLEDKITHELYQHGIVFQGFHYGIGGRVRVTGEWS